MRNGLTRYLMAGDDVEGSNGEPSGNIGDASPQATKNNKAIWIALIVVLFIFILNESGALEFFACLLFALILLTFPSYYLGRSKYQRNKAINLANIDEMTGKQFEDYVATLFRFKGYEVKQLGGPGDLGVDLIAKRYERSLAIQAKRYKRTVSRRAISDAVAGKIHYGVNTSMVVTSSGFSAGAKELAKTTGCVLIDRESLANWIIEFQQSDV